GLECGSTFSLRTSAPGVLLSLLLCLFHLLGALGYLVAFHFKLACAGRSARAAGMSACATSVGGYFHYSFVGVDQRYDFFVHQTFFVVGQRGETIVERLQFFLA